MRLFSYCIPVDDGAAPNPFGGLCTLAICKPVIRRIANVGDWVVGLGGKHVNGIDYSGKLVFAMKVTRKMTISEYDDYCIKFLPEKIPDINHNNYNKRLGDCIYDFVAHNDGELRDSVHGEGNRSTDLGGKSVLISNHFFYFGDKAIKLPPNLLKIVKQGQAHKSNSNEDCKEDFVKWIENLGYNLNSLNGEPQITLGFMKNVQSGEICASIRCKSAKIDEENALENKC